VDKTSGFLGFAGCDDEKKMAVDEPVKQQIPHPLKKLGFGVTALGLSGFVTCRDQLERASLTRLTILRVC
jgi:hypothetical protein